jgi:hypothetical protein
MQFFRCGFLPNSSFTASRAIEIACTRSIGESVTAWQLSVACGPVTHMGILPKLQVALPQQSRSTEDRDCPLPTLQPTIASGPSNNSHSLNGNPGEPGEVKVWDAADRQGVTHAQRVWVSRRRSLQSQRSVAGQRRRRQGNDLGRHAAAREALAIRRSKQRTDANADGGSGPRFPPPFRCRTPICTAKIAIFSREPVRSRSF